jgi:hypothetical protein
MSEAGISPEVEQAERINRVIVGIDRLCESEGFTWSEHIARVVENSSWAREYLIPDKISESDIDELARIAEKLKEAEQTGKGLYLQKVAAAEVMSRIVPAPETEETVQTEVELFRYLQESEVDVEAWQEAINTYAAVRGTTWSKLVREFHHYAMNQIPNRAALPMNEHSRDSLAELQQISMDLVWRETSEDSRTDDLQPRAIKAIKEVVIHLPKEEN